MRCKLNCLSENSLNQVSGEPGKAWLHHSWVCPLPEFSPFSCCSASALCPLPHSCPSTLRNNLWSTLAELSSAACLTWPPTPERIQHSVTSVDFHYSSNTLSSSLPLSLLFNSSLFWNNLSFSFLFKFTHLSRPLPDLVSLSDGMEQKLSVRILGCPHPLPYLCISLASWVLSSHFTGEEVKAYSGREWGKVWAYVCLCS